MGKKDQDALELLSDALRKAKDLTSSQFQYAIDQLTTLKMFADCREKGYYHVLEVPDNAMRKECVHYTELSTADSLTILSTTSETHSRTLRPKLQDSAALKNIWDNMWCGEKKVTAFGGALPLRLNSPTLREACKEIQDSSTVEVVLSFINKRHQAHTTANTNTNNMTAGGLVETIGRVLAMQQGGQASQLALAGMAANPSAQVPAGFTVAPGDPSLSAASPSGMRGGLTGGLAQSVADCKQDLNPRHQNGVTAQSFFGGGSSPTATTSTPMANCNTPSSAMLASAGSGVPAGKEVVGADVAVVQDMQDAKRKLMEELEELKAQKASMEEKNTTRLSSISDVLGSAGTNSSPAPAAAADIPVSAANSAGAPAVEGELADNSNTTDGVEEAEQSKKRVSVTDNTGDAKVAKVEAAGVEEV
eukprot:g12835.t1